MVIQVYALTSNVEEAEVEQFYEDLQDLLELTAKKDVLFILGDFAVQGTLKSLLQNHSSKASIFWCSAFFTVSHIHT